MSPPPSTPDRPKEASFIKIRFVIAIMAVLCPIVCYMSRQNLSLAIVSIVKEVAIESDLELEATTSSGGSLPGGSSPASRLNGSPQSDNRVDVCPAETLLDATGHQVAAPKPTTYGPRYDWSPGQQSRVFEFFFITYVLFQIPGGRLAETLGAKWILFTAAAGSSIVSLLAPWAISWHVYAFCGLRAIMGVCQAALYPSLYVLFTQWLPPVERSQGLPILGVGAYIGSIIASSATGFFSEQPSFGWPFAFYVPGAACALWALTWALVGESEPKQHKYISLEELDYIESKMEIRKYSASGSEVVKKQISWIKLLKSQHIWAFVLAFFASNWSFTIVLLQLPTYLNDILLMPPFKNGIVNAIIYLLFCISSPIVGAVSTLMVQTRPCGISSLQTRKLFQSIALFSQAICFILLTYIGCDITLVLTILYIQIVTYSFVNGGEVQIASDLSLDFAGTIYAIGNCVGSSTGFIVPYVKSVMIQHRNRQEWCYYFYLAAAVSSIGGIFFLIFGKNDLQDFSVGNQANLSESQIDICESGKDSSVFSLEVRAHEEKSKRSARGGGQKKQRPAFKTGKKDGHF